MVSDEIEDVKHKLESLDRVLLPVGAHHVRVHIMSETQYEDIMNKLKEIITWEEDK